MLNRFLILIISAALCMGCSQNNTDGESAHNHSESSSKKESTAHDHEGHNHEGESCNDEEIELSDEQEHLAGIQVVKAERKNINNLVEFPAEIAQNPGEVSTVTSPVAGRVVKINADYGGNIRGGGLIAVIENPQNMGQKFEVKAPASGMVSKKLASVGEWVEPGRQLCEIVNTASVDGVIKLYPDETGKIKKGQQVEFIVNGNVIKSAVNFISPVLDPVSKTLEIRAKLNNSNGQLSINSYVSARVITGSKNGIIIPRSAILPEDDHYIVYVKKDAGYEKKIINIGVKEKEYVEIIDGINEGELVVSKGAYQLKNINYSSGGHGGCEH